MDGFERGYEFAARNTGALYAGADALAWIDGVEGAIEELYSAMNSYDYYKSSVRAQESLKGFLAEVYAAGTANVDAAVKRLPLEGSRLDSRELGSADISCGDREYQLKFLVDPKCAARKLATTLRDSYKARPKRYEGLSFDGWAKEKGFSGKTPDDLLYGDMRGLIPSDKLEAAREYAQQRIDRAARRNLESEVERWTKVRDNLTDRVRASNGVTGRGATNEEMRQKAIDVSNGKELNPADDGFTVGELISVEAILKQSFKAGATAAAMGAALKVAPEIYRAIDYLISEGELDQEHLRAIGSAARDGAGNGFITGSATAAITAAAGKGMFGQTLRSMAMSARGSNAIAALVVLAVETCRDSYLVASGQMQPAAMASSLGQSVFSTVCMLVGGTVATVIAPQAAIPALIGSLAGGAAGSFAFKPISSCVMRVCAESGFTFFGLVDQDYQVPDRLLRKLGIKGPSVKTAAIAPASVESRSDLSVPVLRGAELHTVDVAFAERGLIGLNKIGYLEA